MNNRGQQNHPHLDILLAFSENRLSGSESTEVHKHLDSCAICRLESKCLNRFSEMGEDHLEDDEVQWEQAELDLEHAWHAKIQPSISEIHAAKSTTRRNPLTWLVPVAAAAALALIFLGPSFSPDSFSPPSSTPVIRGAQESTNSLISLESPSGQLESPPIEFSWNTETECENFTFEIFTSDLKSVFVASEIENPTWELTDEALNLLSPKTIYIWNVRGYNQLKPVAESGNSWFRFPSFEK